MESGFCITFLRRLGPNVYYCFRYVTYVTICRVNVLIFYVSIGQESIARLFGFFPCSPDPASPSVSNPVSRKQLPPPQFIHHTGSVFLMILSSNANQKDIIVQPSPQRLIKSNSAWFSNSNLVPQCELGLTSYITRHVIERQKWQQNQEVRVGFLWAWNSMQSKRWRNPSGPVTDETTTLRLLNDLRKFCANDGDRLKKFWRDCVQSFERSINAEGNG